MTMTRRELLASGAVLGASLTVGASALAATDAPAASDAGDAFARAAADCVRVGEECLQHCLTLLASGDESLGDCAKSVQQMLAVCRAAGPLAYAGSKHLGAFARLCADVCGDCEAACRKHESRHAICKQCADACAKTVAAAKKIAG